LINPFIKRERMRTNHQQAFYSLILLAGILLLAGCGRPTAAAAPAPAPPLNAPLAMHPMQAPVMPDRLVIPTIELDIPVIELGWSANKNKDGYVFSEWDVAEYAAGWHKNSAQLGEPGNIVMSGHNNILGAVFRKLDQLRRGDSITVWAGKAHQDYVVDRVMIVPEKYATPEQRTANASWIGAFDNDRLTLVSCWPRDDNTHRIIVVAYPDTRQPASAKE
jgi:sortase A